MRNSVPQLEIIQFLLNSNFFFLRSHYLYCSFANALQNFHSFCVCVCRNLVETKYTEWVACFIRFYCELWKEKTKPISRNTNRTRLCEQKRVILSVRHKVREFVYFVICEIIIFCFFILNLLSWAETPVDAARETKINRNRMESYVHREESVCARMWEK